MADSSFASILSQSRAPSAAATVSASATASASATQQQQQHQRQQQQRQQQEARVQAMSPTSNDRILATAFSSLDQAASTTTSGAHNVSFAPSAGSPRRYHHLPTSSGRAMTAADGYEILQRLVDGRSASATAQHGSASATGSPRKQVKSSVPATTSTSTTVRKAESSASATNAGADVWTRLYRQDTQTQARKFYDSKNLVNSLENERDRYLKLEEEYRRFAKEAHRERERLAQEIRLLQDDSSTDIVSLQKALMHKQDEYLEVCRRFEEEKMKSDESVTLLRNDREKLGQELARMRHALTEADTSMKEQKQFVTKVLSEKKRMADQLAVQVADTKKAQEQLKEREANWLAEKEMRMQLDVHIIQLQHTLAQREDECKELRNQSARKDAEISDLRRLQFTVEQLQKRIVEHKEKEAKLQETIEGHVARERQMVMDQQDLERQEKRHAEDLHRLSLQENAKVLEVEKLKQQLKAYAGEVQQWMDKHQQKALRVEEMTLFSEKQTSDINQLQKQIQLLKHDLSLTDAQVGSKDDDIKHFKDMYVELQNRLKMELQSKQEELVRMRGQLEKQQDQTNYANALVAKLQSHVGSAEEAEQSLKHSLRQRSEELEQAAKRIRELQNALREEIGHNKELHEQVQLEIREREQYQSANAAKLAMAQEKMEQVQASMAQTQDQLQEYQDAEVHIRNVLRQKEDLLRRNGEEMVEAQAQLRHLSEENEQLRRRKKDDVLQFQDKFHQARLALEQEINGLKDMVQQKSFQVTTLKEQLQQTQLQLHSVNADKMRLESSVGEQSAIDGQLQRQLQLAQQRVQEKEHELSLLSLKHQNVQDQVKRLEGELEVFRHLGTLRDGSSASPDMNRLSTNVTGLTKRLKEQVQQLVDRDTYRSSNSDLHLSNPADRRTYTARTDVRPATVSPSRATSRPYYGDLFEEVGAASRKKYTSADVRSGAAAPANGAAEQYQRSPARGVSSPDMSARGSPSIGRRASPSVGSNGRKY